MILLDSDPLTVLKYSGTKPCQRLVERLSSASDDIGTTIINAEEQLRGWLSVIAKEREVSRQIAAYRELSALFEFFHRLQVHPFSADAADRFRTLRGDGLKIGSMDLKIACIALAQGAKLLTRNNRDFSKVPGLTFENWLD